MFSWYAMYLQLEGCCEGTVAKDMIFDFPAVEYCRDQVIGEDPNNIRVDIVGVTDQPTPAPTAPTPSSAPTPVPTVTVDPAGNGTIIYVRSAPQCIPPLARGRFSRGAYPLAPSRAVYLPC